MIRRILLISFFALNWSCSKDPDGEFSGGTCDIIKTPNDVVCLSFASSFDTSNELNYCTTTLYPIYQISVTADGNAYASSILASGCPVPNRVGSCAMSAGTLQYYDPVFSAISGEADCTLIHSGVWTP